MTIPNSEHLLEQAEGLIHPSGTRRARETDFRRAISSAYYAVFHSTLKAAADEVLGRGKQRSPLYRLIYRGVDHRRLRELCKGIEGVTPASKYRDYVQVGGFEPLRDFAKAVVELQELRERADYDPLSNFTRSEARHAINLARRALNGFAAAEELGRQTFLILLLFNPRSS